MKLLLEKLLLRQELTADEVREAFGQIVSGEAEPIVTGAFLVGLQAKGVTADELAGAVAFMRDDVVPIDLGGDLDGVIDTCGTGGSGSGAFNISTATAITVAACGVRVVKHGNRAVSSKTGSADVLEALGLNLDADPRRCFDAAGICFAFARNHHPALLAVAPLRKQLGVRTIFNLMGPLTNPAGVRRQLLGVAKPEMTRMIATVLGKLGSERAWTVHSDDGQDDFSPASVNRVTEWHEGELRTWTLDPAEFGLGGDIADLRVENPHESARMIRAIFDGSETGTPAQSVMLNAAAALVVAGGVEDIATGLEAARHALDSGRATDSLELLLATSNA